MNNEDGCVNEFEHEAGLETALEDIVYIVRGFLDAYDWSIDEFIDRLKEEF